MSKIKCLIVDDEELARLRLHRLISASPDLFVVGEAENGLVAVQKINELKPDLVFLDIQMPGIDGFETCKILRGDPKTEKIPVILLTGLGKTKEVEKGYSCGANDYLIKPVNWERLKDKVAKLI